MITESIDNCGECPFVSDPDFYQTTDCKVGSFVLFRGSYPDWFFERVHKDCPLKKNDYTFTLNKENDKNQ